LAAAFFVVVTAFFIAVVLVAADAELAVKLKRAIVMMRSAMRFLGVSMGTIRLDDNHTKKRRGYYISQSILYKVNRFWLKYLVNTIY
jgi:hypothetical protein